MSDTAAADAVSLDPLTLIDVDRYPLHRPDSAEYAALVEGSRAQLADQGTYDLVGFLRPHAIARAVDEMRPLVDDASFLHRRMHNVWFLPPDEVDGVAPDHPSLAEVSTSNRTVCADQMAETVVLSVYEWAPLRAFIAATVGLPLLHMMADPLARLNVMSYRDGEALNWHFDRAEFTNTLLLQRPEAGGEFELRPGLRSNEHVDHDGIAAVVTGTDPLVQQRNVEPGTLNVFTGRSILHRVAPVRGPVDRMIAVLSYSETDDVMFTPQERIGFYGRS